jgi:hypothetical protein
MFMTAEDLREQVIKPTLNYLGEYSAAAERELLAAALCPPNQGPLASRAAGLGLFGISSAQHRDLWDRYLAFRPEIASRVRGLASQRAFLANPVSELATNLSYCTAIAWFMLKRARVQAEGQEPAPSAAFAVSA